MPARNLPVFQLTGYSRRSGPDSMQFAREVLDHAGAQITDIKRFSNKQIVFQVNVRLGDWELFLGRLLESGLRIEAAAVPADLSRQTDADGDLFGTVTVVISGDDEERTDLIPSVPG